MFVGQGGREGGGWASGMAISTTWNGLPENAENSSRNAPNSRKHAIVAEPMLQSTNVQHKARDRRRAEAIGGHRSYVSCYGHCSVLLRTTWYRAPSCGRWPRSHAPAGQCRGSVPVISLRCRAVGCELDGGCASHAAPARLSPVAFGDGLGHVARGVELVARVTHVLRLPPPPYRTMPWDTVPWDTVLSGNTVLSGDTCWLISAMPPALSAIGP